MYQPIEVRDERKSSCWLRIFLAFVMGGLILLAFLMGIHSGGTASQFADTGLPNKVATHTFLAIFQIVVMFYGIYGLVAVFSGTRFHMQMLYYSTATIIILWLIMAMATSIPCANNGCDVDNYLEELMSKSLQFDRERRFWHNLQRNFMCCGLNGRKDYGDNPPEACSLTQKPLMEWVHEVLFEDDRGCLTVVNWFDARFSTLTLDGFSLAIIVCLLLVDYSNNCSSGSQTVVPMGSSFQQQPQQQAPPFLSQQQPQQPDPSQSQS